MKSILSVPSDYFPQYDELYVISDLHLGGTKGFQIFNAGAELEKLIDHLSKTAPKKRVALLINGDLVDFLAEKPALPFDPVDAVNKLDRIVEDPAFSMVWRSLQDFVASKNRSLIINLGNHDLELALPWVRARLLQILSKGDETPQGRITLAFEGMGYVCRVGNAQILCVHGNEVDEWNVADYEKIRRLGRDMLQGRPVDTSWIPNAGTQLVIQIMNGLKSRYPFIDLLKPEAQAVVPTLLALAPDQRDKLGAIAVTAHRLLWDKARIATSLLGREEDAKREFYSMEPDSVLLSPTDFSPLTSGPAAKGYQKYAEDLLEETEKRVQENVLPISLIAHDQLGQTLGFSSALMKIMRGEDKSEILREALEQLDKDRSFDLKNADDTYNRLDDQMGDGYDFVIAGHTHLDRAIPRQKKKGWYYNSGTWVRLIKLEQEVLQSKELFSQVFNAFKTGTLEALDTAKIGKTKLIMRRLTVVKISADDRGTSGKLLLVNEQRDEELFTEVPDSNAIVS